MSANRFSNCPQCEKRFHKEQAALRDRINSSYGKVSQYEYEKLQSHRMVGYKKNDNLREDWEIIVEDELIIRYEAFCEACGLKIDFTGRQPIATN